MEYESKRTARQEWGETSRQTQERVNACLEELQFDIDAINLELEQLSRGNPEQLAEYESRTAQYLDSKWDFMDDVFLVTGTWMAPSAIYDPDEQRLLFQYGRHQAFDTVRSYGFTAYSTRNERGEDLHRIGLTFLAREREIDIPLLHGCVAYRYVAEPRQVTLQYLRPGMEGVVSSDLDEVNEAIQSADSLLESYLNDDTSDFYRVGAKQQYEIITSILDSINEVLPSPEVNEVLRANIVSSKIYLQHYNNERIVSVSHESGEFQLVGHVQGVTTFDVAKYYNTKQFRNASDCESAKDGLALIVSADESNFDFKEYGKTVIVPLRHTTEVDLSIE